MFDIVPKLFKISYISQVQNESHIFLKTKYLMLALNQDFLKKDLHEKKLTYIFEIILII